MGAAWQGSSASRLACNSVHMASSLEEPSELAGMAGPQMPLCVSAGGLSASHQALERKLERLGSMMGSLIYMADFAAQAHQA